MYKQKQLCNIAELPYFQYVKDVFWVPYGHSIEVLTRPVNLPEENWAPDKKSPLLFKRANKELVSEFAYLGKRIDFFSKTSFTYSLDIYLLFY